MPVFCPALYVVCELARYSVDNVLVPNAHPTVNTSSSVKTASCADTVAVQRSQTYRATKKAAPRQTLSSSASRPDRVAPSEEFQQLCDYQVPLASPVCRTVSWKPCLYADTLPALLRTGAICTLCMSADVKLSPLSCGIYTCSYVHLMLAAPLPVRSALCKGATRGLGVHACAIQPEVWRLRIAPCIMDATSGYGSVATAALYPHRGSRLQAQRGDVHQPAHYVSPEKRPRRHPAGFRRLPGACYWVF